MCECERAGRWNWKRNWEKKHLSTTVLWNYKSAEYVLVVTNLFSFFFSLKKFNTITDKTGRPWFIHKGYNSHIETFAETTTQAISVINNLSFNSVDNLLRLKWEGEVWGRGVEGLCLYLLYCCKALAVFLLTQFLTECVSPWSEQRGTIQMGIK